MLLVRLLALIIAAAIAASLALWLFTGKAEFLAWAIRLAKFALIAAGLVIVLLLGERLIVL